MGLMHDTGRAAFGRRSEAHALVYSHEKPALDMPEPYERQLQQHAAAWAFFSTQAPSYQKAARWWVVSAKAEATRARRLAQLIDDSARGQRLANLSRRPKATAPKEEAEPAEP
ncbi:YdeI/OmpD-associated family protein [Chloroflexia bacterium SDU3-3]|nr:YdeI/OmpD-associated family protein [Chloroflexia bacterium SDU3-3]